MIYSKIVKDIPLNTVFYHSYHTQSKMPSTRSGIIYNASSSKEQTTISAIEPRRSPRNQNRDEAKNVRHPVQAQVSSTRRRGNFLNEFSGQQNQRPKRTNRTNRTAFSAELLREICDEEDNDTTSDYEIEDEEVYRYTRDSFIPIALPRYEVNIDFDEASAAWRSNKRRVGESWVYKRPTQAKEHAASLVSAHIEATRAASSIALNVGSSIASRVKEHRRVVRNA